MRAEGLSVAVIHGGLSQNQRDKAMERFIYGDCLALVATDVAARGIDVEGVQCVVHYDPPENGKAYKHRSGRTARAGAYGSVISLVQKPQKSDFHKIQRQVGIKIKFTSPEFNKLPERVEYTPPKRKRKMVSPLSNKRRRGRSRFRGKPKKAEEPSAQRKVEQQVERASFFRKNKGKFGRKNKNKFGGNNRNQSGKKQFPKEEDRPQRRKKPTYGSKGLTNNEDGSPKKYGGPNKDKSQEKYGGKPYRGGRNNSGKKPYRGGGNNSGGRPYRGGKPPHKDGGGRGNQNNTSNKFRNKSNRNSNRKPSPQR